MIKTVFLLMIAFSLGACRLNTKAEQFVSSINSAGGNGSVDLVKDPTRRSRSWIVVYDSVDGQYYAVEVNGNNHVFRKDEDPYVWYLENRISVVPERNGYYEDGRGRIYESSENSVKDLEKFGAELEAVKVGVIANNISTEFALSNSRSKEIAKLVHNWSELGRSMTDSDLAVFSQEVLGSNLLDVKNAVEKRLTGEEADFSALMEVAAEKNGTSPEHMKAIVDSYLK